MGRGEWEGESQANETKACSVIVLWPCRGPAVQGKGGQPCWGQHYQRRDKITEEVAVEFDEEKREGMFVGKVWREGMA